MCIRDRVGVLILGEAAVRAGLVSSAMIIVVALTAIASFVTPIFSLSIAVRLLRFPIILLGGTLGLFGVVFGFLIVGIHLSSLRSFGVPFLEPIAPVDVYKRQGGGGCPEGTRRALCQAGRGRP